MSAAALNLQESLWQDPDTFRLAADSAHVWSIGLDRMPPLHRQEPDLLAEEEWAQSRRFERAAQTRAFLCRRILLRQLLARYANCHPMQVAYKVGDRGKPKAVGAGQGIGFNASSSGSRVLIAVLKGAEIGVDVEELRWRQGLEEVAVRYFNPAEQARLAGLAEAERQRQFFHIWTRKEALAKLSGEGLAAFDGDRSYLHSLCQDLPMGEGFVAHVAVEDPRVRVKMLHWAPDWDSLAKG